MHNHPAQITAHAGGIAFCIVMLIVTLVILACAINDVVQDIRRYFLGIRFAKKIEEFRSDFN